MWGKISNENMRIIIIEMLNAGCKADEKNKISETPLDILKGFSSNYDPILFQLIDILRKALN